ncbi:tRNA pseudouridine(38/39) synthase isoform X2 [Phalaenopsis equestris]|uniref:tRNA pseudouridine(38/39) synthase isoform X2 n=1 Tax=Phalaenopsis equestris TaxID=78828 RepID=UPI0009E3FDDF|nr:tRNA pseudouridine(38/39) synthase isoform X2 [Phalaenopsis equestris]
MATNIGSGCGQAAMFCPMESSSTENDLTDALRQQLNFLAVRIEELQRENDNLTARISRCQCSEVKEAEPTAHSFAKSEGACLSIQQDSELSVCESNTNTLHSNNLSDVLHKEDKHSLNVERFSNCTSLEQANPSGQYITTHECARRYVALKIIYFGQRFYGFASQTQMEPTVESEIFKALERTKLLIGTRPNSHYSRCGRTDKGVSATGQVISLYLRSNGKEVEGGEEINYVMVLNRVLPKDIRVIGWAPISLEFSARFSCLSREYVYLFWRGSMDISVMQKAAQKFIGEHDFRNFCKMDAVNVKNYRRHITEFAISPCNKWSNDDKLWAITIKGSAFLWHQVRCMVSILFMIGEGLESPNIINVLLDIHKTPRKPQYNMASELPLMLHCCEFKGVNLICSSDARRNLQEHFTNELKTHLLQAAIIEEALHCLQTTGVEETTMVHCKKKKGHISLMLRPTERHLVFVLFARALFRKLNFFHMRVETR